MEKLKQLLAILNYPEISTVKHGEALWGYRKERIVEAVKIIKEMEKINDKCRSL